jgi:hypothetical protein
LVALFRWPRHASAPAMLAIVSAVLWIGYNAFMLLMYMAVMSPTDAEIAADYWRYMPHATLPALYVPVVALVPRLGRMADSLRRPAVAAAAVALPLCLLLVRGDIREPSGRDLQTFIRNAAKEISGLLPPGATVLIVPASPSSPFAVALRYHLWQLAKPARPVNPAIVWDADYSDVNRLVARGGADFLIIQDAERDMDEASRALGLRPIERELALFAWQDGQWVTLYSWSVPNALVHRHSSSSKRAETPAQGP